MRPRPSVTSKQSQHSWVHVLVRCAEQNGNVGEQEMQPEGEVDVDRGLRALDDKIEHGMDMLRAKMDENDRNLQERLARLEACVARIEGALEKVLLASVMQPSGPAMSNGLH